MLWGSRKGEAGVQAPPPARRAEAQPARVGPAPGHLPLQNPGRHDREVMPPNLTDDPRSDTTSCTPVADRSAGGAGAATKPPVAEVRSSMHAAENPASVAAKPPVADCRAGSRRWQNAAPEAV